MSTLESTISMLEVLPEADLIEVQQFAKRLFMLAVITTHSRQKAGKKYIRT